MTNPLSTEEKLNVLASAQWLLFREKNWSRTCTTSNGQACQPWDTQADAWSAVGALYKALYDKGLVDNIEEMKQEMEVDIGSCLLDFNSNSSHLWVVEAFYNTMGRLCEELDWSMMIPAFPLSENYDEETGVMFMSNKDLKDMDEAQEEHDRLQEERRKERNRLDSMGWRDGDY